MMMKGSRSAWVQRQKELLDLELQAEVSQLTDKISSLSAKNCEIEGLSLLALEVSATRSELFGRCAVVLQKIGKHPIPNGFKVGDEVTLYNPKLKSIAKDQGNELQGVVRHVSQVTVEIVIEEYDERLTETPLRLDKRSSQKTHEKMSEALSELATSNHPTAQLLLSAADEDIASSIMPRNELLQLQWNNDGLNESQKRAVMIALQAPRIAVIHGPPGTGKTSTVVELILQAMRLKQRVLVCAPSNIAVDTILIRLTQALSHAHKESVSGVVRLGHPARVVEAVLPYTLDHQIDHDDGTDIVRDVRKEIDDLRGKLKSSYTRRREPDQPTRKDIKTDLRIARKEVIAREKEVVKRILKHTSVVMCTCVGAGSRMIKDMDFDLVVIDEAAQGLEAACWIPILLGRKVVLAGDHCQLPPTIKSREAEAGGLHVTLFERIIKDHRYDAICTLLNVQYRMNNLINQWASHQMYGDEVISAEAVAEHSLQDILPLDLSTDVPLEDLFPVLLMIDSSGCAMFEDGSDGSVSHRNPNEAQLVALHTISLLCAGLKPKDIGIITPYNGQLEVLRDLFGQLDLLKLRSAFPECQHLQTLSTLEGIDIKTIDGFQGGEKECIIISLVRSNERREVGFLGEHRRINVAVTRAKRHLALICDSNTCSNDKFIKTLLDHFEEHGQVIGAEDFLAEQVTAVSAIPTEMKLGPPRAATVLSQGTKKVSPAQVKGAVKHDKKAAVGAARMGSTEKTPVSEDKAGSLFSDEVDKLLARLKAHGAVLPKEVVLHGSKVTVSCVMGCVDDPTTWALTFPSSLSSFQRMIVHAASEKFELHHASMGEGDARHVEVSLVPLLGVKADLPADSIKAKQPEDGMEDGDLLDSREDDVPPVPVASVKKVASKPKKDKKPAVRPPPTSSRTPVLSSLEGIDDEDLLLQLAISDNMRIAEAQKYRLKGTQSMPNWEKESAKQKLRSKLVESQEARRPEQPEGKAQETTRRPKVEKKPVPNFGGGRVGTK